MLVPIYNPFKTSKDDYTKEEALMLDKKHNRQEIVLYFVNLK